MALKFYTGMFYLNSWTIPAAFTLAYWFILDGWNASVNRHYGTDDANETKWLVSNQKFQADIFENTGVPSSTSLVVGVRNHLAVTATSGSIKTYINGILEATSAGTTALTSPANLGIGGRYGAFSGQAANAKIEDFRIYNRLLDVKEIQTINALNGADGIIDGLINNWLRFDKADGSEIGTAPGYDETPSKQTLNKYSDSIYYQAPNITRRKRAV